MAASQESHDHADPLSARDHINMDAFIEAALQDHTDGVITKDQARVAIAHVMTALAIGNIGEAQNWFEQGRKFIHRDDTWKLLPEGRVLDGLMRDADIGRKSFKRS